MSYLKEFQKQIENNDFQKFLQLWEEYCTSDTVDVEEFADLLKAIKASDLSKPFGQFIETAIPLWRLITDEKDSYLILSLLIDLETKNTPELAEITLEALKKRHGSDPLFNERLRLIGLRTKDNFQGALAKYDLLAHLKKGKFVFHHAGWGTGEVIDVSSIREQIVIEFENVSGRKDLSYENAFKTLIPLQDDHFLARRFSNPDLLEKEAKENPMAIIRMLLKDLGPQSAIEIKDELCELVIPEANWTKWWQNARAKIKKDTMIESPESLKDSFRLRKSEVSHEERLQDAILDVTNSDEIVQTTYNFVRDHPHVLKNKDVRSSLQEKLEGILKGSELKPVQILQLQILLENHFSHPEATKAVQQIILTTDDIEHLINEMDIIAFKKRALTSLRENRKDWVEKFLNLLFSVQQVSLRDYILKELSQPETLERLKKKLQELVQNPAAYPEVFVWYFQKVVNKEEVPFNDKEGLCVFFESFLVLFSILENRPAYRELLKKMYQLLSGKRYMIVRLIFENSSIEFIKEFLLLASKCQSLTDHDIKILHSLAEVVQPSLSTKKGKAKIDHHVIWTTEEGYFRTQDKIRHIGTVDIVENAKEIEAARSLGDLRENSEYKFALEKRSRLQGELKMFSEQFNRARIITRDDIPSEEAGVGTVIDVIDPQGKKITYTILGPWDADADKNILSFQSKLAQAMVGCKVGEKFQFRDEDYQVVAVKSFLDK